MGNIITIGQIKDGMVTAEPVLNSFGFTLIPAGTVLGDRHKRILKTWNVFTVSIKGDDYEEELEISEELKSIAIERLAKRMKWTPRNVFEINLYQTAILRAAKLSLKKSKGTINGDN